MSENPYEASQTSAPAPLPTPKRTSRFVAYAVLAAGVVTLLQGVLARYIGWSLFTGAMRGPSLTPIYLILAGIGICLLGLAIKTFADRKA